VSTPYLGVSLLESISAAAGNLYQNVCLPPHDVSGYLHACDSKLVEIDAHACGTPRRNRPGWKVLEQDIHLVDLDFIRRRDLLGGLIHEYELAASAESDRVSRHPAVVRRATGGS
jgi:hypothetical protein